MKPTVLTVNVAGIPDALKSEPRWMCWRSTWSQRDGKQGRWTKPPFQPSGDPAKPNDPSTWASFDEVLAAYRSGHGQFDGVGFGLGDGWCGLDLDHCCQHDGLGHSPMDDAAGVVTRLTRLRAYFEVSPSGTGYKVIGRSARIGGQIDFANNPPAFTGWTSSRFFTITGHAEAGDPMLDLTPLLDEWFPVRRPIHSTAFGPRPSFLKDGDVRGTELMPRYTDDQIVKQILATPQADKFIRLVRGDMSEYGNDHSRADLALLAILNYWCQGDLDQVDRMFRQSGLMRDKWNAASYRRSTLLKVVCR